MKEPSFDLTGKKALVTGGNTGIGLGIAKGLSMAGAAICIIGRTPAKNQAALAELQRIHPGCREYIFDLENLDQIDDQYAQISSDMGGIDILVNNAGLQHRERAETVSIEIFERIMRINVTAPFVLSQTFARERIRQGASGSVIMIGSLQSEASRPTTSPYTAAKGAIRQLVKALAVDWAQFGIRVNGIGPGYIQTEMTHPLWDDEEFSGWVISRTPLRRWGIPQDLAGAAVFLASDASAFVTGQILYMDGGWLAAL